MELKYLVIILSTLFSLCHAITVRDRDYYNSKIVQRQPGNDRVQIRVYRGPETSQGGRKFAPWGFLVRQPADD